MPVDVPISGDSQATLPTLTEAVKREAGVRGGGPIRSRQQITNGFPAHAEGIRVAAAQRLGRGP